MFVSGATPAVPLYAAAAAPGSGQKLELRLGLGLGRGRGRGRGVRDARAGDGRGERGDEHDDVRFHSFGLEKKRNMSIC